MGLTQLESHPSSKILFTTDFETVSHSRLTLKNVSQNSILFKVKLKYPEIMSAHPPFGELLPDQTQTILLQLQPTKKSKLKNIQTDCVLIQAVTISRKERRRLENIDFFIFWSSLPKRRFEHMRYICSFINALKSETYIKLQKENHELRKVNRLLRQELDRLKEKQKGAKMQYPFCGSACRDDATKLSQKNYTFNFRKLFGCAFTFGLGKIKNPKQ